MSAITEITKVTKQIPEMYNDDLFVFDKLSGDLGTGNDTPLPNPINTTIGETDAFGLDGNDKIFRELRDLEIHGDDGDNKIYGGEGDDALYGEAGKDVLYGRSGDDWLAGGSQADVIYGGAGDDFLIGDTGKDKLRGGAGDDSIFGGRGADNMRGGSGDDDLHGFNGADILKGGGGNDVLFGDKGNDTLTGGAGADVFHFGVLHGSDVITDFEDGVDLLHLGHLNLTAANALDKFYEIGSANDNVVGFEYAGTIIEINGLDLGDISAADLIV